jgi:ADP-ribosylglycohydrolase
MATPEIRTENASLDPGVLDRARGALLGQIIGDALGTTVEFESASAIASKYPGGLREIVGGGPFRLRAGQITDDTEQALTLARSLVARRGYDPDHVARGYLEWLEHAFDCGNATIRAFADHDEPLDRGPGIAERIERRTRERWERHCRAIGRVDEPNGSLMRASPLGVLGWALEPSRLAELAARDSRLSHPAPSCQAACVVFTRAIASAIRTGAPARAVFDEASSFARASELAAWAIPVLEEARRGPPDGVDGDAQGWIRVAFQNAFTELLHATSFEEALVRTVGRGGDTDTNGCIAGALLGAVFGEARIPERWRAVVLGCRTDRGPTFQTGDARELAESLARVYTI